MRSVLFDPTAICNTTLYLKINAILFLLFKDTYASANGAPVVDDSNNVELVAAAETGGVTTVTFKRKLNTCDKDQDNKIMVFR